jgi:hypothetical protein
MDKLVEAMEKLKKDLFYGGRDVGFIGDMVDVINHAVSTHLASVLICSRCYNTSLWWGICNLDHCK